MAGPVHYKDKKYIIVAFVINNYNYVDIAKY